MENISENNRIVLESEDSEAIDEYTECWDMEVEVGYERFGFAEMQEIFEEDAGTEDGGQSKWSLEKCQEVLGEVTAEKTRVHGSVEECGEPMEDVGQESLIQLRPDKPDYSTNEPAVEICMIDTASIDLPTNKDPEDGTMVANA